MRISLLRNAIRRDIKRNLNVKLLENNSIIQVKPGFMRNTLYPNRLAEYLSEADVAAMQRSGVVAKPYKDAIDTTSSELDRLSTVSIQRSTIDDTRIHGSVSGRDILQIIHNDYKILATSVEIIDDDRLLYRNDNKVIKQLGSYKINVNSTHTIDFVVNAA